MRDNIKFKSIEDLAQIIIDDIQSRDDLDDHTIKVIHQGIENGLCRFFADYHKTHADKQKLLSLQAEERLWWNNRITEHGNEKATVHQYRSYFGYTPALNDRALPFDLSWTNANKVCKALSDVLEEIGAKEK